MCLHSAENILSSCCLKHYKASIKQSFKTVAPRLACNYESNYWGTNTFYRMTFQDT